MTRLSGRVPETGTAISGATVAIIDTQGTDDTTQWSIVASDTTDANGEWSVSGLEPSAVERYHAVAQFDSGVEFVNFESLPFLSTPADAFAPTTPVNVGTPTAEVGIPAFFDVTITNTNTPVVEGDILTVDFSANNTGTFQDTQDIRLEIDNVEEDRDNNVTLDGGVSTTGTLQWDTTNETAAQYTATVLSNDDADSVTVQVERAIPDSGVSRHTFDDADTSGSTAVDIWNGNDGTINGATTGVTGQYAEAYSFDGTDDSVSIPSGTYSFVTSSGFTFSLWAKTTAQGRGGLFAPGDGDCWIEMDSNETIRFQQFDGSNAVKLNSTSQINDGSWRFVTATFDGSTMRIYIDAAEENSASHNPPNTVSRTPSIGLEPLNSIYFDGDIDDVRIYDKALTSTEVSDLYNNGAI